MIAPLERDRLSALAARARRDLVEDIAPFWLRHGFDREYGGILTALDRAVAAFPEAAAIYERNMQTLRDLGREGWQALDVGAPRHDGS